MSKRLVAYFSASGVTAKVAENLSDAIGADVFEIQPEVPYIKADLNWMDKKSRSTIEMSDPTSRPAIAAKRDNMDEYDTIFVGFPIWWYVAPTIINTFLESYNLKGKTIIPFATSGGSGMGKTNEKLAPSCSGAKLLHGKVFSAYSSKADLSAWVETLTSNPQHSCGMKCPSGREDFRILLPRRALLFIRTVPRTSSSGQASGHFLPLHFSIFHYPLFFWLRPFPFQNIRPIKFWIFYFPSIYAIKCFYFYCTALCFFMFKEHLLLYCSCTALSRQSNF